MPEFEIDQQTEEEIEQFIDEWFATAPEKMGVSEAIAGCEVTNVDTYGVGVGVFPRYITVRVYEYTVQVLYRGFPTIALNDLVTVLHFREANRYEVIGISGNTGSSPQLSGSGANTQVAYWTGTYVLAGDAGLTYNAATDTLSLANSLTFTGATGVNDITVPDNLADALSLDDAGGINYLQITSTDAQPVVVWNNGEADVDFRVAGTGRTNALFVRGDTGAVGVRLATPATAFQVNGAIRTGLTASTNGEYQLNLSSGVLWELQNTAGSSIGWTHNSGGTLNFSLQATNGVRLLVGTTTSTGGLVEIDDTGTQLRLVHTSGVDYCDVSVDGNGRVNIDPSGDFVGINIVPDSPLHVADDNAAPLRLERTGASNPNEWEFLVTGGGAFTAGSLLIQSIDSDADFGIRDQSGDARLVMDLSDGGMGLGGAITDASFTGATLILDANGRVSIGNITASAQLHVDQSSTSGAIPVLYLDQADVSEEFIRFQGSASAGVLTQSIVDEGDQGSETREGWVKVYVVDDGNQITDQAYFVPIYTLSA